ncbi:MAG: alpha/beta fold hydrolase [Chloroflexi bacterium]|nr:alpha/beta fold hydrolase [Chloroflexota bacterium]MBV9601489.1 alpha/beta fold hydrolase [Chloroflexota bacterium]
MAPLPLLLPLRVGRRARPRPGAVPLAALGLSLLLALGLLLTPPPAPAGAAAHEVYVRTPSGAPDAPVQVVVALHGMGDNGPDFAAPLAACADQHRWLLVAPTMPYGDWTDPAQLAQEEPSLVASLSEYVRQLPDRTGLPLRPRVVVLGHSRGAQLALRFAQVHPEQVAAVAALSAGTYTLPLEQDPRTGQPLVFPFGVADLASYTGGQAFDAAAFARVPVWLGVGAHDDQPGAVPRAWDGYLGDNRVDRARAFAASLGELGNSAALVVFPDTEHTLTEAMRADACAALAQATAADPAAS